MQAVYLGGDPKKYWWRSGEVRQGKEGNRGHVNERVIAVGDWGSMPLKDLWETMGQR